MPLSEDENKAKKLERSKNHTSETEEAKWVAERTGNDKVKLTISKNEK